MAQNPFEDDTSDDEKDESHSKDKGNHGDEATPIEEGTSGNEATPRRRSQRTTGQVSGRKSLKELHESRKQSLLGPDASESQPGMARPGGGRRGRNAQTVGDETDEEEGEGKGKGENGSGVEQGGNDSASDSLGGFVVDTDDAEVLSP